MRRKECWSSRRGMWCRISLGFSDFADSGGAQTHISGNLPSRLAMVQLVKDNIGEVLGEWFHSKLHDKY
jgi:hypothetical protein